MCILGKGAYCQITLSVKAELICILFFWAGTPLFDFLTWLQQQGMTEGPEDTSMREVKAPWARGVLKNRATKHPDIMKCVWRSNYRAVSGSRVGLVGAPKRCSMYMYVSAMYVPGNYVTCMHLTMVAKVCNLLKFEALTKSQNTESVVVRKDGAWGYDWARNQFRAGRSLEVWE
jgi:hypothetical protein